MTNLPQVIERVGAGDFQTTAKVIPPQEVGGALAASANEKALVISGGRVVDMFSGRSQTVPSYAEVAVASLRHYHMAFGFGDCSRSPRNRPPAMIHVPDLPEIEASNGEIIRSMTVAVRFSLTRDDRSNIEKLLAINAARKDAVTVQDLANELAALPPFISALFAGMPASDAESIRFDKRRIDAVRQQILMAANMALGEYGASASAATRHCVKIISARLRAQFPLPKGSATMEMLKRLAPNYWAGYYAVYVLMTALLTAVFRAPLRTWPETEALFVAAAIFAVSAGAALLSAIIAEGVGYMVLLIPRRIKKLKDEGRAEGREEGRAEGVQEGIATGHSRGVQEGIQTGRAQERDLVDGILARYDRGEITMEQLHTLLTFRNGHDRNGG